MQQTLTAAHGVQLEEAEQTHHWLPREVQLCHALGQSSGHGVTKLAALSRPVFLAKCF